MKIKRASNGIKFSIKHVGSRLQAVEGMLNSNDSSKQRVARQARRGRVVSAMQRCAVQLFNAVVDDSRVSMFFKNSDPACKDCWSRVWHGHGLTGYELSCRFWLVSSASEPMRMASPSSEYGK